MTSNQSTLSLSTTFSKLLQLWDLEMFKKQREENFFLQWAQRYLTSSTNYLQIIGFTYFSYMISSIGEISKKGTGFQYIIDEKLQELEMWIKRIEKSNIPYHLNPELYR